MDKNESYEGEASEEDMKILMKTVQMLRSKKAELLKKRESLIQTYKNYDFSVKQEEKKKELLIKKVEKKKAKVLKIPSKEEQNLGIQLKAKLSQAEKDLEEIKRLVIDKEKEKKEKYDCLYSPTTNKTYKKSVNYIHQSLLDELTELVAQNASPSELQAKEKQIRLCEDLTWYY